MSRNPTIIDNNPIVVITLSLVIEGTEPGHLQIIKIEGSTGINQNLYAIVL